MKHNFEKFCKEPEKIENYEKAKKDNFKGWHCHHRLETHTSDGERRLVNIPVAELQALGIYYNRPPEELIFLTASEHNALPKFSTESKKKLSEANKGKKLSEETRKKLREANKGKKFSEETRKKLREAKKGNKNALGCKRSEETRKKLREAKKGMHWYNNGKINIMSKECPPSFVPGMLRK